MTELLATVLPVFGIVGIGWIAARTGLLSVAVGDALSRYVFTLALPCYLFSTIGTHPLPDRVPLAYWAAYFGSMAAVWVLTQQLVRRALRMTRTEAVIAGLGVAQANTAMVGVPLIMQVYGPDGAVPVALLLGVNLPVTMTAATVLFEAGGEGGWRRTGLKLARNFATHPVLIGIFLSFLAAATQLQLPEPLLRMLTQIGGSMAPCALIGLGIALHRYGLGGQVQAVALISAMKLLVMPLGVWAIGTALGLEQMFVGAAVLFASAPCGINVYIFAQRYRTGEPMAAGAICVTTALSLLTSMFWLWFLNAV